MKKTNCSFVDTIRFKCKEREGSGIAQKRLLQAGRKTCVTGQCSQSARLFAVHHVQATWKAAGDAGAPRAGVTGWLSALMRVLRIKSRSSGGLPGPLTPEPSLQPHTYCFSIQDPNIFFVLQLGTQSSDSVSRLIALAAPELGSLPALTVC